MPVTPRRRPTRPARAPALRLRGEGGFTMILALCVLTVTALLSAAVFLAVNNDASLTRVDLSSKRAYAAAQAGVQEYLYQLNVNSTTATWWETCANDMTNGTGAPVAVPGATYGETYAYTPVLANLSASCVNANPATLIDSTTGTLRMKVTGYAGTSSKTIIASVHTVSPLSYIWYTVHETVDTALGDPSCSTFYWQTTGSGPGGGPNTDCYIYWTTGDHVNGPLYTQDQLLISPGASPTFGRTGTTDQTVSQQTKSSSACVGGPCPATAQFANPPVVNPTQQVQFPSDNSKLLVDAGKYGMVFNGTTTLTISGTTASGWTCPTSSTCSAIASFSLTQYPIVYATNAAGCTPSYAPTSVTYPAVSGSPSGRYYGPCGDIYVSGSYSTPLTIAAGNNVILTGSLTNSTDTNGTTNPTGSATLGIVAYQYVRVMHTCSGGNPNVTVDGAILTLTHSFFVDNYSCGGTTQGTLTVHGSIAQFYRGIVGTSAPSGYLKNYNYDSRLGLILPPYLFDLQNTQWTVFRETLCSQTGTAGSCSNPSS